MSCRNEIAASACSWWLEDVVSKSWSMSNLPSITVVDSPRWANVVVNSHSSPWGLPSPSPPGDALTAPIASLFPSLSSLYPSSGTEMFFHDIPSFWHPTDVLYSEFFLWVCLSCCLLFRAVGCPFTSKNSYPFLPSVQDSWQLTSHLNFRFFPQSLQRDWSVVITGTLFGAEIWIPFSVSGIPKFVGQ